MLRIACPQGCAGKRYDNMSVNTAGVCKRITSLNSTAGVLGIVKAIDASNNHRHHLALYYYDLVEQVGLEPTAFLLLDALPTELLFHILCGSMTSAQLRYNRCETDLNYLPIGKK